MNRGSSSSLFRAQLRKDFRSQRSLLTLYAFGLTGVLAYDLGALGPVSAPGFAARGPVWELLSQVAWIIAFSCGTLAIVRVVLEDSPARRERFLAVRPMPNRLLLLGKVTFLLLGVLVPAVLREFLYLSLSGLDPRAVFLGTLQTAGIVLAIGTLIAGFACWWRTLFELVAGAGLGYGMVFLSAMGISLLTRNQFHPHSPLVTWQALMAGGILLLLIPLLFRKGWPGGFLSRCLRLAPVALLSVAVFAWTPWRLVEIAEEYERDTGSEPNFDEWRFWASLHSQSKDGIQLLVHGHAPDFSGENPLPTFTAMRVSDGKKSRAWRRPIRPEIEMRAQTPQLEGALEAAVKKHLDREDRLVWVANSLGSPAGRSGAIPIRDLDPEGEVTVEVEVSVAQSGWEVDAELPAESGVRGVGRTGAWKIEWRPDPQNASGGQEEESRPQAEEWDVAVTWSRKNLWLSSRLEERGPRVAVVLVDREEGHAFLLDDLHYFSTRRGFFTALPQTTESARMRAVPFARAEEDPDRFRVLFLRRSFGGVVTHRPEVGPYSLANLGRSESGGLSGVERETELGEFLRWLWETEAPAPTASSATVAKFLRLVSEKAERTDGSSDDSALAVGTVASYVPNHLPVLLELIGTLPMDYHRSRRLFLASLIEGLQEEQRESVAARLNASPELLEVIRSRGWIASTRDEMRQLLLSGRNTSSARMLAAVARTPEDREWLLRQRATLLHQYGSIRGVPGFEEPMDRLVRDAWKTCPVGVSPHGGQSRVLRIALEAGLPDAVEVLHHGVALTTEAGRDPNHQHESGNLIEDTFALEEIDQNDRYDSAVVVPWFLGHRPEDFRFDPISRLWVLRSRSENEAPVAAAVATP